MWCSIQRAALLRKAISARQPWNAPKCIGETVLAELCMKYKKENPSLIPFPFLTCLKKVCVLFTKPKIF